MTMNIPEGWKLVPIEPTEAMLRAGDTICLVCCSEGGQIPTIWETMLAAAPKEPSQPETICHSVGYDEWLRPFEEWRQSSQPETQGESHRYVFEQIDKRRSKIGSEE